MIITNVSTINFFNDTHFLQHTAEILSTYNLVLCTLCTIVGKNITNLRPLLQEISTWTSQFLYISVSEL